MSLHSSKDKRKVIVPLTLVCIEELYGLALSTTENSRSSGPQQISIARLRRKTPKEKIK